jgi:hypothetical protein
MLGLIATLAYVSFAGLTVALVWAGGVIARKTDSDSAGSFGTNPHAWRF